MLRKIITGRDTSPLAYLVRFLLLPIQFLYTTALFFRHIYYSIRKNARVGCPVICVGNLSMGGTGKTPMVIRLAARLAEAGKRVVIVSRGYGTENGAEKNDEAKEMARFLPDVPHLQNPDRVAAAREAVKQFHADVILLDDGFQHRRLHRDADIVLIDATEFRTFSLFPLGLLREPVSALRRADAVVITRKNLASPEDILRLEKKLNGVLRPETLRLTAEHVPAGFESFSGHRHEITKFRGKKVGVFCGIGNPDAFLQTLRQENILCGENHAIIYPDHHAYTPADKAHLAEWAKKENFDAILCTWKDLVKIAAEEIGGIPVFALRIEMKIQDEEKFFEWIEKIIRNA